MSDFPSNGQTNPQTVTVTQTDANLKPAEQQPLASSRSASFGPISGIPTTPTPILRMPRKL